MEKMRMESVDMTAQNIDKIAELFPNCVTEMRDEQGRLKKAVNFDMLRQMLSPDVVEGNEAYEFTWVGKKASIVEANRPIRKTLRPCPEESVDWDATENLYIEGDNLEVLKLLQESYLGMVKMIYIDPPYNTGNDFIYRDNFAMSGAEYKGGSGQVDEETGNRLFKNTDTNGRFHSDWCSMMYSRLYLSRNLLTNDGVIFISIDDNEVATLSQICDEVFGSSNFVANIIWKKRSTPPNDKVIGAAHEYILLYARNAKSTGLNLRERSQEQLDRYKNPDNHPKGAWAPGDLGANVKGGRFVQSLYFPIVNPNTGEEHYPPQNGNWRFNKETIQKLLANNEIYFGEDGKGRPKLKRFLCNVKGGITYTSLWDFVPFNTQGSKEMTNLLGNIAIFDNPKPVDLLKELIKLGGAQDAIILDFFSGSATTAHAAMRLNAEDGGHRRFIMVQLPEPCDKNSEAFKSGYSNICDIGKERIRRAAKKISADNPDKPFDGGFRVFKLADTNMSDIYYSSVKYDQIMLPTLEPNFKPDRTSLDLLFHCLLEWGLPLSLPYTSEQIDGCTVHNYNGNDFVACFDENITERVIRAIALSQPLRAVFRDACFTASSERASVYEYFRLLSPDTRVRVI